MGALEKWFDEYKDRADFRIVYIREAHPSDGRQRRGNSRFGINVESPKTLDERTEIATVCAAELKISIPIIIDGLDDKVGADYGGWPDRIYVVGTDGRIVYQSGPGPRGFKPQDAKKALTEYLKS